MKVFVALPVFNLINPKIKDNQNEFLHSKHTVLFNQVVGASVEHARSILIDRFLKTDCEYYFTIDADIYYLGDYSDVIDRLISLDKDIVGGLYVYKKSPCLPVFRPIDLQNNYETACKFPDNYNWNIPNEPFEVAFLGNGFKLVKREVIEKLKEIYLVPNLPMIYKGEYLSEDFAFDQRARESGYYVWVDPTFKLAHEGNYLFTLSDMK